MKAHESKTVIFQLTPEELGFYDPDGNFLVESGTFVVMAGTNSVQILSKSFELK
nr:fibronectin type III-like domain-contianing protein [Aestuariivivens sediminis]